MFTLSDESVSFLYSCIFGTEESGSCRGVAIMGRRECSITPVIFLGEGGVQHLWSLKMRTVAA